MENKDWREELEKILEDNFPKLNQDNPEIASPNNRSAALVMYAFTKMLIQKTLNEQEKTLKNIPSGISVWKEMGKKWGYWEFFTKELKEELLESLPKEKKGNPEFETNQDFGRNQAIQEAKVAILKVFNK